MYQIDTNTGRSAFAIGHNELQGQGTCPNDLFGFYLPGTSPCWFSRGLRAAFSRKIRARYTKCSSIYRINFSILSHESNIYILGMELIFQEK